MLGPSPLASPSKRIAALDFWRGAYLLMIYINHIPDNPLSILTLRNWGFADSAEAFVFISGFSAMLAFGPFFEYGGFGAGVLRTLKRAWQLFCAHILLVFAMAATLVMAGGFFDSKPLMEELNFSPFFVETDVAIVKLLKLGYMPNLTDILPLYIVLVFLFPLAWILLKKSTCLGLGASFALWLWVHFSGKTFNNYPDGMTWFFNPLAWQLLFVAGMAACKERARLAGLMRSRFLFALAVVFVFGSVLVLAPWTRFEALSTFRLFPLEALPFDDKTNLSPFRVLHLLAITFLAVRLFPSNAALWKNKAVGYISLCGRHSLSVFCSGSVLALVITLLLKSHLLDYWSGTLPVAMGLLLLLLIAFFGERGRQRLMQTQSLIRAAKAA